MFNWVLAGSVSIAMLLPAVSMADEPSADDDKPSSVEKERADEQPVAERAPHEMNVWWVGLMCHPAQGAIAAQLGLDDEQGLIVEHVVPEGPAAKARVEQFDILLKAGDRALRSPLDLARAVNDSKGRKLELIVLRKSQKKELVVTPAKHPEMKEMQRRARIREAPLEPEDLARIRHWMEEMERRGAHEMRRSPMRFRFVRPGVVLPPNVNVQLRGNWPSGLSVSIKRHGDEPAEIMVKRGDDRWELTENDLDRLPEDIRDRVGQMLGGRMSDLLKPNQRVDFFPRQNDREAFPEAVERRLDEMSHRMEHMLESLERLRRQQPREREDGPNPNGI